jgi:hypothetical protein
VIELQLTDFFKRPVGARGLELNEALKQADGSLVRLTGQMVAREDATPGRFQLAPRPVRLSEHADGEADDLPPATVTVLLDPSQAQRIVVHRPKPVTLIGRLLDLFAYSNMNVALDKIDGRRGLARGLSGSVVADFGYPDQPCSTR